MKILLTVLFSVALFFLSTPSYAQEPYPYSQGPLMPTQKPQEVLTTERPLEIWTFPSTQRLVRGKTLLLTVQVIWRLGISVELEDLLKANLPPFQVEKVTIGERQIFENERDFRVVQYILSLPEDAKEGEYVVPSFAVSYTDEVEKKKGQASSSPVAVRKVPLVTQASVDRDVIETGDVIHYSLTILHEKDTEVLLKNLKEVNFEPFSLLRSNIRQEETPQLRKVLVDYYLSIYEMGTDKRYEIPPLSIFYYKQSVASKGEERLIETKEVRTQPVPVIINRLLKTVDVPLEGLKGPMNYRKEELYLRGYFAVALGTSLLLILFMPIGVRKFREGLAPIKRPSESPELAAEELRTLLSSLRISGEEYQDRRYLEGLDKAFRTFLGTRFSLPKERALSLTSAELLNSLSPELAVPLQKVLKGLDGLIFGDHLEREKLEEVLKGIEGILESSRGRK